jgi:hypothetical protein
MLRLATGFQLAGARSNSLQIAPRPDRRPESLIGRGEMGISAEPVGSWAAPKDCRKIMEPFVYPQRFYL